MSDQRTGCTGKRRYLTFNEAQRVARRVRRQMDGSIVEPYHCTFCGGAHVGSARDHGRRDARRDRESEDDQQSAE